MTAWSHRGVSPRQRRIVAAHSPFGTPSKSPAPPSVSSISYRAFAVASNGTAGLTVTANAEVGDYEGEVEAAVEGDGTTIAFNARYLADVLTNVSADQFALELNGPLSPGVFKPVGDDRYVHVVMPVRTTS